MAKGCGAGTFRPMGKRTRTKASRRRDDTAAVRGRARAEFFANGGDAARWGLVAGTGRHTNRRREASRTAARGRSFPTED